MTYRKSLSLTGPHLTHLYFNYISLDGVQNYFQLYDFKFTVASHKGTSTLLTRDSCSQEFFFSIISQEILSIILP